MQCGSPQCSKPQLQILWKTGLHSGLTSFKLEWSYSPILHNLSPHSVQEHRDILGQSSLCCIHKALDRRLAPLKPSWESASHSSSRLMIPVELLSGLGVTSLDILCSALFPWTPCCFQGKNDLTLWMDWICSNLHWRLVGQTKSCHSPFKGFLGFIWKARVKQNSNQWFCSHGDLDLY